MYIYECINRQIVRAPAAPRQSPQRPSASKLAERDAALIALVRTPTKFRKRRRISRNVKSDSALRANVYHTFRHRVYACVSACASVARFLVKVPGGRRFLRQIFKIVKEILARRRKKSSPC